MRVIILRILFGWWMVILFATVAPLFYWLIDGTFDTGKHCLVTVIDTFWYGKVD